VGLARRGQHPGQPPWHGQTPLRQTCW
jgi:hypothetical protein